MRIMKYVYRREGTYTVIVQIPEALRNVLGNKRVLTVSLRTKVEREALRLAPPIIEKFLAQIDTAKITVSGTSARAAHISTRTVATTHSPINPDLANGAIRRWRKTTIDAAQEAHFNGLAKKFDSHTDEALALDRLKGHLRKNEFNEIADFDARLCDALCRQAIPISVGHPAIPNLRHWFAEAWLDVENYEERFRRGQWSAWPEELDEDEIPVAPLPTVAVAASSVSPALFAAGKGCLLINRFVTAAKISSRSACRPAFSRL